jgi:hypothetical protein
MFSEEFISEFGDHVDIELPDDMLESFFQWLCIWWHIIRNRWRLWLY